MLRLACRLIPLGPLFPVGTMLIPTWSRRCQTQGPGKPQDTLAHLRPIGPERSSYSYSSVVLLTPPSSSTSGALSQGPDKAPREAQEESTRSHASALLGAHVGALLRPSRGPPMSQRAPIGLQEWPKEGSRRARDYGLRPSLPPCLSRGSAWS